MGITEFVHYVSNIIYTCIACLVMCKLHTYVVQCEEDDEEDAWANIVLVLYYEIQYIR